MTGLGNDRSGLRVRDPGNILISRGLFNVALRSCQLCPTLISRSHKKGVQTLSSGKVVFYHGGGPDLPLLPSHPTCPGDHGRKGQAILETMQKALVGR